jgi:hypothetical protein
MYFFAFSHSSISTFGFIQNVNVKMNLLIMSTSAKKRQYRENKFRFFAKPYLSMSVKQCFWSNLTSSKLFKTVQNCSKLFKTVQNCSKLFKTDQNCSKLIKTDQNCSKLIKTVQKWSKLIKTVQNWSSHTWLQVVGIV